MLKIILVLMVDRNIGILLDYKDFLKFYLYSGFVVGIIDIEIVVLVYSFILC